MCFGSCFNYCAPYRSFVFPAGDLWPAIIISEALYTGHLVWHAHFVCDEFQWYSTHFTIYLESRVFPRGLFRLIIIPNERERQSRAGEPVDFVKTSHKKVLSRVLISNRYNNQPWPWPKVKQTVMKWMFCILWIAVSHHNSWRESLPSWRVPLLPRAHWMFK